MQLISIDLELNQPSRKIIQIGYVIFNTKTWKVLKTNRIYVNPNEAINPEITKLTGIDDNHVDTAGTLQNAYDTMVNDMMNHQVNQHPVQWGTDHLEIRRALGLEWEDYFFSIRDHDIKSFYQLIQAASPNTSAVAGLGKAIRVLGKEWDYTHGNQHDALADAYNTMLVYRYLVTKVIMFDRINNIMEKQK